MSLPTVLPSLTILRLFGLFCLVMGLNSCSSVADMASDTPMQTSANSTSKAKKGVVPHGLIIHGGAGAGSRASMTAEREARMRAAMTRALDAGYQVLDSGGSSLGAVTAAIVILENEPTFNAGIGAVFNAVGSHELDASIMDGRDLNAGAVAGVSTIKNPILLARAVMEHSPHVMLSGKGRRGILPSNVVLRKCRQNILIRRGGGDQLERALQKMGASTDIPLAPNLAAPQQIASGHLQSKPLDKQQSVAAPSQPQLLKDTNTRVKLRQRIPILALWGWWRLIQRVIWQRAHRPVA